jgi:uncharacterized membrane protein
VQVQLEREGDSQLFEDLERYLRRHPRLTRFLFNPAGFVFLFGWIVSLGILVGWLGILAIDPQTALNLWAMEGTELLFGREVAIPLGLYQYGLPAALVFMVAFMNDLVTTAWLYPAFYAFRKRHRGRRGFWGYFFRRMEQNAARNKEKVEKYGAVGLYLFMLIPFAVNGPLIGAIVGKLAGIRTRFILPTVILATATATAGWTLAWMYFRPQVEWFIARADGPWIAAGIAAVFTLVLAKTVVGFLRDVRSYRRIERRRREIARRLEAGAVTQVLHARDPDAERVEKTPQAAGAPAAD